MVPWVNSESLQDLAASPTKMLQTQFIEELEQGLQGKPKTGTQHRGPRQLWRIRGRGRRGALVVNHVARCGPGPRIQPIQEKVLSI